MPSASRAAVTSFGWTAGRGSKVAPEGDADAKKPARAVSRVSQASRGIHLVHSTTMKGDPGHQVLERTSTLGCLYEILISFPMAVKEDVAEYRGLRIRYVLGLIPFFNLFFEFLFDATPTIGDIKEIWATLSLVTALLLTVVLGYPGTVNYEELTLANERFVNAGGITPGDAAELMSWQAFDGEKYNGQITARLAFYLTISSTFLISTLISIVITYIFATNGPLDEASSMESWWFAVRWLVACQVTFTVLGVFTAFFCVMILMAIKFPDSTGEAQHLASVFELPKGEWSYIVDRYVSFMLICTLSCTGVTMFVLSVGTTMRYIEDYRRWRDVDKSWNANVLRALKAEYALIGGHPKEITMDAWRRVAKDSYIEVIKKAMESKKGGVMAILAEEDESAGKAAGPVHSELAADGERTDVSALEAYETLNELTAAVSQLTALPQPASGEGSVTVI